jgi:hypothetical protein
MFFPRPTRRFVAGTMLISACICFLASLASLLHGWHFWQSARRADGRIIQTVKSDSENGVIYTPVFVFEDNSGAEHTIHASTASSQPEYQAGDSVTVLYAAADPTNAKIDTFFSVWGLPFVTGLLAAVYCPLGITTWYWPQILRRFRRNSSVPPRGTR